MFTMQGLIAVVLVAVVVLLCWRLRRMGIGRELASQSTADKDNTRRALEIQIFGKTLAHFTVDDQSIAVEQMLAVLACSRELSVEEVERVFFTGARALTLDELGEVLTHVQSCRECEQSVVDFVALAAI